MTDFMEIDKFEVTGSRTSRAKAETSAGHYENKMVAMHEDTYGGTRILTFAMHCFITLELEQIVRGYQTCTIRVYKMLINIYIMSTRFQMSRKIKRHKKLPKARYHSL